MKRADETVAERVERWLSTQGGSLDELKKRFALSAKVARNVRYEKLLGVDRHASPEHPGHYFFFRGKALVMLYISGQKDWMEPAALMKELGGPGVHLRSRAGKTHKIHVYPERGIAFSERREIDFVEVFPPTTLERYQAEIYDPPGPFIK